MVLPILQWNEGRHQPIEASSKPSCLHTALQVNNQGPGLTQMMTGAESDGSALDILEGV